MTRKATRSHGAPSRPATPTTSFTPPAFEPVQRRPRHDGWTRERQVAFIEALASCGCVDEACARVGMSRTAAYDLRADPAAESFRTAWDLALDHAIQRLADAAFGRAINGVARPIFYRGEQVGERRHYDERLAMFLLRYRDPTRYGAWIDKCDVTRQREGTPRDLGEALRRLADPATEADDWEPGFPLHIERADPRSGGANPHRKRRRTPEETDAALHKLLDNLGERLRREDEAAALAMAQAL